MAHNAITVSTAQNWIPENWSSELEDAAQAWTGLSDLVDRSFESDLSVGDQVHIGDRANPTVRYKGADSDGTYSNVTETEDLLTVSTQAYVGFLVEDIAELQSKHAIRSGYTKSITYSLMADVEGDLTSGLASLPDNFSQGTGALGSDPTTDNIIRAVQYLDDADVPDSDRFFYMSPASHASLLKQDVFVSGDYGPTGAVASGRITKPVYGATTHVSSLASNNPSTAGQSYSWFCHKKGVALAIQRGVTVHTQWENLAIGWGVIGDIIFGFTEHLILPRTTASVTPNDNFNVAISGA